MTMPARSSPVAAPRGNMTNPLAVGGHVVVGEGVAGNCDASDAPAERAGEQLVWPTVRRLPSVASTLAAMIPSLVR